MFCSKCGAKIDKDAEFCKKCGQKMIEGENSKEDSSKEKLKEEVKEEIQTEESEKTELKEEIKKELKEEKPKTKWSWSGCLVSILLFIMVIGFVTSGTGTAEDKKISVDLYMWPIIILSTWFVIWLIIKLVQSFIKNWRKTLIIFGIVLVPVIILPLAYIFYAQDQVVANFAAFQNSFADVVAAKYLGDDIIAGKSTADFGSIKTSTAAALVAMGKITSPNDYETKVIAWSTTISKAAGSKKTWKNLAEPPVDLKMSADRSIDKKMIQASLNRIAATKDYGDWAIASGDKDTMRQIAAELEVENVYLSNVNLAVSDIQSRNYAELLIIRAEAKTNNLKRPITHCDPGPCASKTKQKIPGLIRAARNYSVGDASAAQEWNNNWNDLAPIINITNGYNLSGSGIIVDGKTTTPISPMEQAFNDECHAKGGTPGGTGGVKDRLPTTLTAGTLNCDYKDNGHTCWDTMTRTGQRFMGGDNGCPEEGLLPKPAPVPKTTTPTAPTSSWDGTYHVTYSAMSCNLNTSVGYSSMFNAAGVSDTIVVSGNRVRNFNGSTSAIDSSGNSSFTYPFNYAGVGSLSFATTYHFSGNSVSGQVTMTVGVASGGDSASVRCSENYSGSK